MKKIISYLLNGQQTEAYQPIYFKVQRSEDGEASLKPFAFVLWGMSPRQTGDRYQCIWRRYKGKVAMSTCIFSPAIYSN